jgi:DNA-binding NarL/FixJ family response regulator
MKTQLKIIVVDDNIQFRKSLITFIEEKLNFCVIGEASNGLEFLELSNIYSADIILMDIAMDLMDGFEATKRAFWNNRNVKTIAITMHMENIFLQRLLESGFKGCVCKTNVFNELEEAINTVMSGKPYFHNNMKISTDT